MFQLIIGEQHLLRLLFEGGKLRLMSQNMAEETEVNSVFPQGGIKRKHPHRSSVTGSDESVHKFFKNL